MTWLRRVFDLFRRDVAKQAHTDETLHRVDVLLENVDSVRIVVVPKNARALAALRRLEGHARR